MIILVSDRASVTSAKQFAPVVSVTTLLALTVATVFGFVAYLHGVVNRLETMGMSSVPGPGPEIGQGARAR
jgi:hypothetical protein